MLKDYLIWYVLELLIVYTEYNQWYIESKLALCISAVVH